MNLIKMLLTPVLLAFVLGACSGSDGFGLGNGGGNTSNQGQQQETGNGSEAENETGGSVRIGNGTGVGFTQGVIGVTASNLSAGGTTTLTVNLVDEDSDPITDIVTITFSSDCVSQGLASFDSSTVATSGGLARAVYTAQGCNGDDEIVATATVGTEQINAVVTINVAPDTVLAVQFVSASESNLAIKGTGGSEVSTVTFRIVGALGAPIVGETVSFELGLAPGGVALAQGQTTAVSDSSGQVSTVVQSGTAAGAVKVIATHDNTGIQGESDSLTVSTGIAISNRFSLSVDKFAPPDAFDTDGIPVQISLIVSDQFGNPLPDGTPISFVSPEAGQIESSCTTSGGACSVTWRSADARPANGQVDIMAFMNGAEAFVDVNGNNVYDTNDNMGFTDLGEPCIDVNNNGTTCEQGIDFFYDTNSNGVWDSADGAWNGPCLSSLDSQPIMTSIGATAVCNDPESVAIFNTVTLYMSTNTPVIANMGNFPPIGSTINLVDDVSENGASSNDGDCNRENDIDGFSGMLLTDSNGNPLPSGTRVFWTDPEGAFNFNGPTNMVVSETGPTAVNVSLITNGIDTSGGGRLILNIDLPSADAQDTEYVWTTDDDQSAQPALPSPPC
ncbi:MAG: hypothetical protein R3183_00735 [Oleiphilaceae bacterium]|nr:hypothetical protein [Oleiphilaceae bacterium]